MQYLMTCTDQLECQQGGDVDVPWTQRHPALVQGYPHFFQLEETPFPYLRCFCFPKLGCSWCHGHCSPQTGFVECSPFLTCTWSESRGGTGSGYTCRNNASIMGYLVENISNNDKSFFGFKQGTIKSITDNFKII